ncbi:hypothetical protein Tco_0272667 [Tanacetum coccineum]
MNEEYYEQNSCYDSNSFGFDQFQLPQYTVNHPIFNAQNEFLNSQNKLMEQMTSICDMVGQIMQKKEEERRIVEEQAAKEDMSIEEMRHEQQLVDYEIKDIMNDLGYKRFRGEKIDEEYERDCEIRIRKLKQDFNEWGSEDDYIPLGDNIARYSTSKAIIPDLPIEEPDNSLNIRDEHLSTIPETESDEVIKSSVKNLIDLVESLINHDTSIVYSSKIDPILEEFASELAHIAPILPGIVEADFDPNDDTSSDDDSYENIEYVEALPLNLEYDTLEEENEDQEEKEFDLEDIFQIQDVILREKLLNVHRLITKIESLKNNPTPDFVLKSPSSIPISVTDSDSFFEESDTSLSHSDNSLPEFETFSHHTEETRSGSTTTHANNSLPEYDSFLFEIEPDQGRLISIDVSDNSNNTLLELPEFESFHFDPSFPRPPPEPPDIEISLIIETNAPVINNVDELNKDECFDPRGGENNVEIDDSFTFVTWTFLSFLTYPEVWIKQKLQENRQKWANTDTGNGRAQKKPGNQAKVKKSTSGQPAVQTLARECLVDGKIAQEKRGLYHYTQRTSTNVTSMDCQLGNPCDLITMIQGHN